MCESTFHFSGTVYGLQNEEGAYNTKHGVLGADNMENTKSTVKSLKEFKLHAYLLCQLDYVLSTTLLVILQGQCV